MPGGDWRCASQGKEPPKGKGEVWNTSFPSAFRGAWPCLYLDLGLLPSSTVGQQFLLLKPPTRYFPQSQERLKRGDGKTPRLLPSCLGVNPDLPAMWPWASDLLGAPLMFPIECIMTALIWWSPSKALRKMSGTLRPDCFYTCTVHTVATNHGWLLKI